VCFLLIALSGGAFGEEEEEEEEDVEPQGYCYTHLLQAQANYGWKRKAAAKTLSLTPMSLHGCCKENDWMCGQPMGALNDAKGGWTNSRKNDDFLKANAAQQQHAARWEAAFEVVKQVGLQLTATKSKAKGDKFSELDPIEQLPYTFDAADVTSIVTKIKQTSRRRLGATNLNSILSQDDMLQAGGLFSHKLGGDAGTASGNCAFDIPIVLNGAGFGSAMQNVVNVVVLALHTKNSFGFCVNDRSSTIFTPYFTPFARSCPIADCVKDMGLEDDGQVAHLSFTYQELSRGFLAILACGNVAYYDAYKSVAFSHIYRTNAATTATLATMVQKYLHGGSKAGASAGVSAGASAGHIGVHIRRGDKVFSDPKRGKSDCGDCAPFIPTAKYAEGASRIECRRC
jgi:hypothetical protein